MSLLLGLHTLHCPIPAFPSLNLAHYISIHFSPLFSRLSLRGLTTKTKMTINLTTHNDTKMPASTSKLLSEYQGEKLTDLDRTVWHLFSSAAAASPDNDAIVCMWQADDTDNGIVELPLTNTSNSHSNEQPQYLRWSYRDLHDRAVHLATWLSQHGCQPDSRLACFLWNSAEWGLFFWTAARLSMAYVPLDPRVLSTEADLFLSATTPSVVVVQDAAAATVLSPKLASRPGISIRIQCSGTPVEGFMSLHSIMSSPPFPLSMPITPSLGPASSSSLALLVFTSGTTSTPKGCPHSNSAVVATTHQYDPNIDPSIVDRWLVHTPSSHIFAINNAARAWRLGNAVILASKTFDVSATLRAIVHENVTFMSAVPTLVKALLNNPEFPGKEKLKLRFITIGGTVITPEDIRLCKQGLGAEDAVQVYGMSEGAPVVSWCRTDEMLKERDGFHEGVGKVLPGMNVRVCMPGGRDVVRTGEVGELHVGGPGIIKGYLGGVDEGAFYEDEGGNWLVTGDQARLDEDGVVYLMGRYKDLIIRGGENIYPKEIEERLYRHPDVLEAAVVGLPDPVWGEEVAAFIILKPDVSSTAETIIAYCREHLARFKCPKEVIFMDAFPKTATGKIQKGKLRETYLQRGEK